LELFVLSFIPPSLIAIDHDDYAAKHVGRTLDGKQFFLTAPFVPAMGDGRGCEFIALYLFNPDGSLLSAEIESLGHRAELNEEVASAKYYDKLVCLGEVVLTRIEIQPFSVQRFDTQFGLIVRARDDVNDPCVVQVQPGNYMAFFEPWDSGQYDT
jgi:hypothetical protein